MKEITAVDLGLYNYVKNAFVEGKSKEEIIHALSSKWSQPEIEQVFTAVSKKEIPGQAKKVTSKKPSILITFIIFILLAAAGVLAFTTYKNQISTLSQNFISSHEISVGVAALSEYTEPVTGVSMMIPSDWQEVSDTNEVGNVDGFTASKEVSPFTPELITAGVHTVPTTSTSLSELVSDEKTQLSGSGYTILDDRDVVIHGASGHEFEYTYSSNGKIYHQMDAYILNSTTQGIYLYTAKGLDGTWTQIPANAMLMSISFAN
jgi:hypothetical protein